VELLGFPTGDPDSIVVKLCEKFGLSPKRARLYLRYAPLAVKTGASRKVAQRYAAVLLEIGADVAVIDETTGRRKVLRSQEVLDRLGEFSLPEPDVSAGQEDWPSYPLVDPTGDEPVVGEFAAPLSGTGDHAPADSLDDSLGYHAAIDQVGRAEDFDFEPGWPEGSSSEIALFGGLSDPIDREESSTGDWMASRSLDQSLDPDVESTGKWAAGRLFDETLPDAPPAQPRSAFSDTGPTHLAAPPAEPSKESSAFEVMADTKPRWPKQDALEPHQPPRRDDSSRYGRAGSVFDAIPAPSRGGGGSDELGAVPSRFPSGSEPATLGEASFVEPEGPLAPGRPPSPSPPRVGQKPAEGAPAEGAPAEGTPAEGPPTPRPNEPMPTFQPTAAAKYAGMGLWAVVLLVAGGLILVFYFAFSGGGGGEPEGDTVLERLPESASNYIRAQARQCDEGNANSCFEVGLAYTTGEEGVRRNRGRARELMDRACRGGADSACTFVVP
jgi:hypothetical protein